MISTSIWRAQVRHPIIVIEGPDAVGKTTLADAIVKEIGGKNIHLTYRFPDRMHQYHTAAMYQVLRAATQGPVVLDRWWASELVYAQVYRNGSRWPDMWRMLHRVAMRFGFYYVWCDAEQDLSKFVHRYNILKGKRTELYDSGMDKIATEFRNLRNGLVAHGCVDKVVQFPYNVQHTLHSVIHDALLKQNVVNRTFLDLGIVDVAGNTTDPKMIWVGDKSNPKGRRTPFPFFEYGNSSLWLAQAMATTGIKEKDVMMINAASPGGEVNHKLLQYVHGYYRLSLDIPMIALGLNAAKFIHEATYKPASRTVSHPSYTRRFENGNVAEYKKLKEDFLA